MTKRQQRINETTTGNGGRSSVVVVAAASSCCSSTTTSPSIGGTQQQQYQQQQLLPSSSSSSSLNNMIHGMMTNLDFLSCTSIQNVNKSSTEEIAGNHPPRRQQQQPTSQAITATITGLVPSWSRMERNQAAATGNEEIEYDDGVEIDEIVENLHLQAYQLQRV